MKLSDEPGAFSMSWPHEFVPFTVYLRYVPAGVKRQEKINDFKKFVAWLETALQDLCVGSTGGYYSFDFAKPIAFVPSFGDYSARLTITGHACPRESFTNVPVGQRYVDNDNQIKYGPDAGNASNRVPDYDVKAVASELKNLFQAVSGKEVLGIRIANYVFGYRHGTTIPA